MDIAREKNKILEIMQVHKGERKPILRPALVEKVGASDRVVRDLIAELRRAGTPIINLGNGYFLAETSHEIDTAISKAKSYIIEFQHAINGLESAKKKMFGTPVEIFSDVVKAEKKDDPREVWQRNRLEARKALEVCPF